MVNPSSRYIPSLGPLHPLGTQHASMHRLHGLSRDISHCHHSSAAVYPSSGYPKMVEEHCDCSKKETTQEKLGVK